MIALVVKATFILAAAFCAAAGLRRGSAALRHFIWTAALAAILVLPFARWAPQPAPISAPAIVVAAVGEAAATTSTPPSPSPSLPWLAILYGTGVALAATRFLAGSWRTSWMARRGTPSSLGANLNVTVLLSAETPMPLACGILRPLILLPQSATQWPADRLRSVLLHEAMHHQRRDLLAQAIAQFACCAYWFHPLAWLALARQRAEREHACDDAVLRHGVPAHDYAEHLVEAARSAAAARPRWADAPAMAEASGLERRVVAVLNGRANRRPLTAAAVVAVAMAFAMLLAPLSVITLRAQSAAGISGVVEDPSGGRVPNARVTARNLDTGGIDETTADSTGEYRFPNLASGRYEIQISSRGFALLKLSTTLVSGAAARADGHLAIGNVTESLKVHASRTVPAPAPQTAAAPRRIPVGGNVQSMRLVRQVRPEYPPELRAAGVEGTVVLQAVISKEGAPLELRVLSTTDARLNQAALDAVTKWRYTPTLLNGMPVETLTTISIEFQLDQ
jgi:TonB family protein